MLLIILNTVLQRYGGPGLGDTLVTCATIVQSYLLPHHHAHGRNDPGDPAGGQLQLWGGCPPERIKKAIQTIVIL